MKKPVEFLLVVVLVLIGTASILYIGKNWYSVFPAVSAEPQDRRTPEQKKLHAKRMQEVKKRADELKAEIDLETALEFGELTVVGRADTKNSVSK